MRNLLNYLRKIWGQLGQDDNKPETSSAKQTPPKADKVEPPGNQPVRETPADPRKELEADCYQLGYREAQKSWELEPNPTTLKALEAEASAKALSTCRPRSESSERLKLQKLQALDTELKKRTAARDRAKAVAQACHRELAKLGSSKPYPAMPPVLIHAATLGLAISIAPTLHDLFTGLDPFLKWLAGGACAWGVSLLIIHGIMPTRHTPDLATDEGDNS